MKKLFVAAVCAVLALSLVACSSGPNGSGLKDGTYTAQASAEVQNYTDTLTVTYAGGKITEAKYDAVNADGILKSEDKNYPMDNPPASQWVPELNEKIVAAGTASKVDAVAGATNSSESAKKLLMAIEEAAKKGTTDTIMVDLTK